MTQYEKGRRYEWKIRDEYRKKGYLVIRSAGSKSAFDLVAIKRDQYEWREGHGSEVLLIQCKTGKSAEREKAKLQSLKNLYEGLYAVRVVIV